MNKNANPIVKGIQAVGAAAGKAYDPIVNTARKGIQAVGAAAGRAYDPAVKVASTALKDGAWFSKKVGRMVANSYGFYPKQKPTSAENAVRIHRQIKEEMRRKAIANRQRQSTN